MTNEEFEVLVEKLHKKAEKNPKSYRFKVLLLTILGYGYIFLMLGLVLFLLTVSIIYLVTMHISLGSLKLLIITLPLAYFIIKALFVKMEMPEGYYLKENEAPELLKTIADLSKKLKTPKIHAIVLNEDINASVLQHQQFGQFGPKKNILIIGIPYMATFTKDQYTSILAHELAHISHSDTSFSVMVYRVRETWKQLMNSLNKNEQFGMFLFRKFINWFYPKYSAYTFPLARQAEYAADAASVEVTSPEIVRDTLCSGSISAMYYYKLYYEELAMEGITTDKGAIPYSKLIDKFKNLDEQVKEGLLNIELDTESTVFDTHPSLTERVQAIGMEPNIPKNETSAITHFFANPEAILNHFNQLWIERNGEEWDLDIRKHQRLQELENKDELDPFEKFEKALLIRDIVDVKQAIILLEEIIAQYPKDELLISQARYSLGDLYLGFEETIQAGEQNLRKAMETHWKIKEHSLNLLSEYYRYTEQMEKYEETNAELEDWLNVLATFEEVAYDISFEDHYVPHNMSSEDIAFVNEQLCQQSEINEAYLVRKFIELIPNRTLYHLALKVDVPEDYDFTEYTDLLHEKYNQVFQFPDNLIYYIFNDDKLEKKLKAIEGSKIFVQNEQQNSRIVTEI